MKENDHSDIESLANLGNGDTSLEEYENMLDDANSDYADNYETELYKERSRKYRDNLNQEAREVYQKLVELIMADGSLLGQYYTWNIQEKFSNFLRSVITEVYCGDIEGGPGSISTSLVHASMPEKAMAYILQQPMEVWEGFDAAMDDVFVHQCLNNKNGIEKIVKNEKDILTAMGSILVAKYKEEGWDGLYGIESDIDLQHLVGILEKKYPEIKRE